MDEDFILIGWINNYSSPIIIPKNINWIHNKTGIPFDTGLSRLFRDAGSVGGGRVFIILSQLYKLPNIRNLDLHGDLLQVMNTFLIDKDFNVLLKGRGYTSGVPSKEEYYEANRDAILNIERNYPGLMQRVYLEEEQGQIMGPAEHPFGELIMGPAERYGGKKYTKKRYNKKSKTKNYKK